jgi:hypothetical protein
MANSTPKLALKATTLDGESPVHAHGWSLPTQAADGSWTPGRWSAVKGLVRYRGNGLHVCSAAQLGYWYGHLRGREMVTWVCEYDGHTHTGKNGFAARRVRLLRPWNGSEVV